MILISCSAIKKWKVTGVFYQRQTIKYVNQKYVKCGVPQGSILCPLLFLMFINNLPPNIASPLTVLLADDTNVLFTADNKEKVLSDINENNNHLLNCLHTNKLLLNTDKSIFVNKDTIFIKFLRKKVHCMMSGEQGRRLAEKSSDI